MVVSDVVRILLQSTPTTQLYDAVPWEGSDLFDHVGIFAMKVISVMEVMSAMENMFAMSAMSAMEDMSAMI